MPYRVRRRAPIAIELGIGAALLLPSLSAVAKSDEKDSARPPIVDPRADALLRAMGDYLAEATQFSFRADINYDEVLPTGQKVQFAAIEDVAVQRPGRAYVEYRGDLGEKKLWYDGKQITILDSAEKVYETVGRKLEDRRQHRLLARERSLLPAVLQRRAGRLPDRDEPVVATR